MYLHLRCTEARINAPEVPDVDLAIVNFGAEMADAQQGGSRQENDLESYRFFPARFVRSVHIVMDPCIAARAHRFLDRQCKPVMMDFSAFRWNSSYYH